MAKCFHLGWFLQGSSIQSWNQPWTGNIADDWMFPSFFMELAKSLERAKFDYVLIEDSSYVGEAWNNSREIYLKNGISVPRQDPAITATLLAQATSRIGIVPTLATFTHHPYLVARLISSLDQISAGRMGWNMVTGSSDFAAKNYGLDALPQHDLRYDMADEYIDCVKQLWASWEPGAIVADAESRTLIDHTKVRQIDFKGKYYASRGPLNSGPSPQGQPVIAQAGGSPRGRAFAARHADTIVASVRGVDAMRDYKADLVHRAIEAGRDPSTIKLLFLIAPIIGGTEEEALIEKKRRSEQDADSIQQRLAFLSKITNIDFSTLDLDQPVPPLTTNGHQQLLEEFIAFAGRRTLRQALSDFNAAGEAIDLVGTPEQIALQMSEVMEQSGGDGFLFSPPNTNRRSVAEVADGLVPALQRLGVVRKAYSHDQFRDNLLAF
ncbi:FMN-dependent oxidoreductase, nitrilotriacetate monooxygenase family [Arboricoccus pini]|uniref:FMN-dependent oxidoreductase, nitrilotriacetate monooxygenase family n=1 Tax=Arboricoccus pini TaxID=1963835 RepID=A0A212S334_9PROT|nr:NtaA/DmoA family FMN-dependent monooxygenase [Arboricoccus pini]SNB79436.1 FMN-dependent oxidoreductase, nitrilotriacetate monooxygenase family [Arboricoccus pini]